MQIVPFDAPEPLPRKSNLFSREDAIRMLGIDRDQFDRLVTLGIFPRGIRRHGKEQVRYTRKHMALMLYYIEHPDEFEAPKAGS